MGKIVTCWMDVNGSPIIRKEDGFVIQGNIGLAVPSEGCNPAFAGLIGRGNLENKLFSEVPFDVFSKKEFLRVLKFTPGELRKIADVFEGEKEHRI